MSIRSKKMKRKEKERIKRLKCRKQWERSTLSSMVDTVSTSPSQVSPTLSCCEYWLSTAHCGPLRRVSLSQVRSASWEILLASFQGQLLDNDWQRSWESRPFASRGGQSTGQFTLQEPPGRSSWGQTPAETPCWLSCLPYLILFPSPLFA